MAVRLAVVVSATAASYAAAWLLGVAALVPVLNAGVAWWVMARLLREGRLAPAVTAMLVWAAVMGVVSTGMSAAGLTRDANDDALFLNAGYRDEMLHWVRTGDGPESTPSIFVPRHARNATVFVAAAAASGGSLAMPLGAVQMNYMGEYVGAMAARSRRPWLSALLGWHPWAVARVAGFVILGVVFSGPLLAKLLGFEFALARHGAWIGVAASLLVLDIGLKWALAPAWGRMLRNVAGW